MYKATYTRLREAAAEGEGVRAALHVPLDAHRVDALGDGVDLERQIWEEGGERQAVKEAGADKRRMEPQRIHEGLLAATHCRRTQKQVLVHAVVR